MKNKPEYLPEELFDFAYIPMFAQKIKDLAQLAEKEDWEYHSTPNGKSFPILKNYFKNIYRRIASEKKIAFSKDYKLCCFDLGLVTRTQREPIYALFTENTDPDHRQYWQLSRWFRRGDSTSSSFDKLPDMVFFGDDPSKLVYDTRKELIVNIEHIIQDNKARFPAPYNKMDDYMLQLCILGCIESVKERLKRNYKFAVPQYFLTSGTIQLLIPLCLASPDTADLAIVVEDAGDKYRAATCLTLDMAINNARLLARPDRDWLNP